jgi:hypothetical protein
MYHATKWGIEGFAESVAQEAAPFGIGVTIVDPGGARTEFRYGSAQVADLLPAYDGSPAHGSLAILDPAGGLAPGDPARMATAIIASVDQQPAPLRIMLGSRALHATVGVPKDRVAGFEAQADLAASTAAPRAPAKAPSSPTGTCTARPPPLPAGTRAARPHRHPRAGRCASPSARCSPGRSLPDLQHSGRPCSARRRRPTARRQWPRTLCRSNIGLRGLSWG